jgi:hypothetical protein
VWWRVSGLLRGFSIRVSDKSIHCHSLVGIILTSASKVDFSVIQSSLMLPFP